MVACSWAPFEKPWANVCGKYCRFVARHPWPFIIIPTLLTIGLSSGIFLNFKIVRGVHYLYAPLDAEWKVEEEVFHQNWAATDEQFYPGMFILVTTVYGQSLGKDVLRRKGVYLIVTAKDGGSVLRRDQARDFLVLLDWVSHENFTTPEGIKYNYRDICLQFQNDCFTNAHASFVADIYSRSDQRKFNITYPKFFSEYSTEPIDMMNTLGDVALDSNGNVKSARAWMILYQLKQHSERMMELSSHFELALSERIKQGRIPTHLLNVYYFHSQTFDLELAAENRRVAPRFSFTFAILVTFSVICTFNMQWVDAGGVKTPVIDWVLSKPGMGVVGVVATLMAIISACGLLMLFDVTFVDMCSVMPFLSLTIGIDDTFLMLAAWHETDRRASVEDRIEASMRHAAVSISITSLTDTLAFLIGAITPLPAVLYFCYYSAAAIAFIFLYSLTIFVAFLALQGRWEERCRNSTFYVETKSIEHYEKTSSVERLFNLGSRLDLVATPSIDSESGGNYDSRLWYQRFFEDRYVPFICHPAVQIGALLSFIMYIVVSYFGIQQLVVGFDLIHIIQQDSPSRRFLELRGELFDNDASKLDIAVMRPPNMGDSEERKAFFKFLEEFESTDCSAGRNTTDFWYFAYEKYLERLGFGSAWADMNENAEEFNENLKPFLLANERYSHDILYNNGTMKAFRLTTRLDNYSSDESIMFCARNIRGIAKKYFNEYDPFTYTSLWNLADQFEIIWPQTLQDIYISVLVMVPIALFMIPQPLCAIAIAVNIASIALGVIGCMSWWDVHLDATSMITIAMSVGFSVDFAAHITYGYMTEAGAEFSSSPKERLTKALGAVGWPVTQASLSVVLGIGTLATVDSYVVQTCFKTVLLVIVFGTLHALLYLPLLLLHCHRLFLSLSSKKRRTFTVAVAPVVPTDVIPNLSSSTDRSLHARSVLHANLNYHDVLDALKHESDSFKKQFDDLKQLPLALRRAKDQDLRDEGMDLRERPFLDITGNRLTSQKTICVRETFFETYVYFMNKNANVCDIVPGHEALGNSVAEFTCTIHPKRFLQREVLRCWRMLSHNFETLVAPGSLSKPNRPPLRFRGPPGPTDQKQYPVVKFENLTEFPYRRYGRYAIRDESLTDMYSRSKVQRKNAIVQFITVDMLVRTSIKSESSEPESYVKYKRLIFDEASCVTIPEKADDDPTEETQHVDAGENLVIAQNRVNHHLRHLKHSWSKSTKGIPIRGPKASPTGMLGEKFLIECRNRKPCWHLITHGEERYEDSWRNEVHVNEIRLWLQTFSAEECMNPVVITPYRAQRELLSRAMLGVRVLTIDGFQGEEADTVIVSLPRHSKFAFLQDNFDELTEDMVNNRLVVMLTRARERMLLIGDVPKPRHDEPYQHMITQLRYGNSNFPFDDETILAHNSEYFLPVICARLGDGQLDDVGTVIVKVAAAALPHNLAVREQGGKYVSRCGCHKLSSESVAVLSATPDYIVFTSAVRIDGKPYYADVTSVSQQSLLSAIKSDVRFSGIDSIPTAGLVEQDYNHWFEKMAQIAKPIRTLLKNRQDQHEILANIPVVEETAAENKPDVEPEAAEVQAPVVRDSVDEQNRKNSEAEKTD
ncbi:hypothetical protein QR680_006582 [Steinernema hermaphroditum]|uniref:SSD domain-containing protein n=1 Tax=Steinernema hermaphroditum TaxID=289476 RepID=A0AA39LXC7_9BILA|nr:hypothetical protein QR680_006582 [Steinernema hermaphroditum]